MKQTTIPKWKKSVGDINQLIEKANGFAGDSVTVACVRKIRAGHIRRGDFAHLDMFLTESGLTFPASILPDEQNGRWSKINIHGKEIVHKDLPMITKTYSWESPDYGDWGNGSHTVWMDRDVYQRSYILPKTVPIEIELLGQEDRSGETFYLVKFSVMELLNLKDSSFEDNLEYNANLLQENTGASDVFPHSATKEDYLKTIYVGWEILPPGTRDDTVTRILSTSRNPASPEVRKRVAERVEVFSRLKPQGFIRGTSGFLRYFGAKFTNDCVVFENLDYGNALYVMFGRWEELSRLSRTELLRGDREGFERIVHLPGWEEKLKRVLEMHREDAFA